MCIYIYMYIYMCMYIYIYMHVYMLIYIYVYINLYIYIYINLYVCVHVYVYIYICIHVCKYIFMHIYMYVYIYIYMCVCVNCFAICYICFHPFNILRYVLWSIQKCCIYINWICLRDILQEGHFTGKSNSSWENNIVFCRFSHQPVHIYTYTICTLYKCNYIIYSYIYIYILYNYIYPYEHWIDRPYPPKKEKSLAFGHGSTNRALRIYLDGSLP